MRCIGCVTTSPSSSPKTIVVCPNLKTLAPTSPLALPATIEQRLAELEQRDIGSAFAELRARIEDRILGVEQRNVRTLEQLSETVALIERRFAAGEEEERAARSA